MKKQDIVVVAIDGPASAGKSTVAKQVARTLSLMYIDSGAMYRAVAWKALSVAADLTDEEAVAELAGNMKIELKPGDESVRVFVDGEEITGNIRTPEVTDVSSKVAILGKVRAVLVEQQQAMARTAGVVMEGRDIGTVVFPDTPYKFYLSATARERALRRKKDLEQAGYDVQLDELERDVIQRDERDRTRSASPLKQAEGAMLIDTTDMSIEQVAAAISERVETLSSHGSEEKGGDR